MRRRHGFTLVEIASDYLLAQVVIVAAAFGLLVVGAFGAALLLIASLLGCGVAGLFLLCQVGRAVLVVLEGTAAGQDDDLRQVPRALEPSYGSSYCRTIFMFSKSKVTAYRLKKSWPTMPARWKPNRFSQGNGPS